MREQLRKNLFHTYPTCWSSSLNGAENGVRVKTTTAIRFLSAMTSGKHSTYWATVVGSPMPAGNLPSFFTELYRIVSFVAATWPWTVRPLVTKTFFGNSQGIKEANWRRHYCAKANAFHKQTKKKIKILHSPGWDLESKVSNCQLSLLLVRLSKYP